MTYRKSLCLNMIVKNELANLERCFRAIVDHITYWVIGDTGSHDGTQNLIQSFFGQRNVPGELHSFTFENFEQARNEALQRAYASPHAYDYLLLADADMELVIEDEEFRTKLDAPGYRVIQRADGDFVYWNTRLVQRSVGARYRGVTHEYLDVPGRVEDLKGVWYKDHSSGSNRIDKFERDIRLLTQALKDEPNNERYWFYLAQSYRDAGQTAEAAHAYAKRVEMGGWDEEAWYARLQHARCLHSLGDDGGFLRQALAAFHQRPHRAEPLYDLARYYRQQGMYEVSLLFSEPGLSAPLPEQDRFFLENGVYSVGIREEFAIAAFYSRNPALKEHGRAVCNAIALDRDIPEATRSLARHNLLFYIEPAATIFPSFDTRHVAFIPPDHYRPMNPSVARWNELIMMIQRSVNFRLADDGAYETLDGGPVRTRNFLLHLDRDLNTLSATEILPPPDLPNPAFDLVLGFEDARLFPWDGGLWCSATIRELSSEGWCEQVLARIDRRPGEPCRLMDWRVLTPDGARRHEKNWMPQADGRTLRFLYSCDPTRVVDEHGKTVTEAMPVIATDHFRGGSQMIRFCGGWLTLIHEVSVNGSARHYVHRFVWFDAMNMLRSVSRQFFFHRKGVEYAAGLAWHPDGKCLLISYGVGDSEAWIATVDALEVRRALAGPYKTCGLFGELDAISQIS